LFLLKALSLVVQPFEKNKFILTRLYKLRIYQSSTSLFNWCRKWFNWKDPL